METKTLNQKLLEVQKEINAIPKDENNPFFKSKYFTIDTVLGVVKPILNKYNIRLSQPLERTGILTRFVDGDSGEKEETFTECPQNPDPQKQGAIYTYFRRYCLVSYLGLEGEQDTDANDTAVAQVTRNVGDNSKIPETVVGAGTPVVQETLCGECGNVMQYKTGTSKAGKPYKGMFCPTKGHTPIWL